MRGVFIGAALCLMLTACSSPAPEGPVFSYSVSGCEDERQATRAGYGGDVETTVEEGMIRVKQQLIYLCCTELELTVEQERNRLKAIETNIGEVCRCVCEYQATANIAGLDPGTHEVRVWGVQYQDQYPLELLGEGKVTS